MKMNFSKDELAMVYQYAAGTKEDTLAGLKEIRPEFHWLPISRLLLYKQWFYLLPQQNSMYICGQSWKYLPLH